MGYECMMLLKKLAFKNKFLFCFNCPIGRGDQNKEEEKNTSFTESGILF